MQSGCRWVYTLMDWDTGEVVAKGTSVELVEQGYFPDVNKLSSVWNNLEKCKNPSPKNYRWKMERKSTKDDRARTSGPRPGWCGCTAATVRTAPCWARARRQS